ncbi:penicillin-binding protein, partial [candidate division KSB1 bacterium]
GMSQCGGGLQLLPRDMAKIGLLVLNDGKWQNKQIVSKEWIHESTSPHMTESKFFGYGYQWWHRSKNNQPWWKKSNTEVTDENDMIVAMGYGGQYIMVIRDLNMVVVTTASNYDDENKALGQVPMVIADDKL